MVRARISRPRMHLHKVNGDKCDKRRSQGNELKCRWHPARTAAQNSLVKSAGHAVIDDCHYCQQKNWCNFNNNRKKVLNIKRQEGNMQPQGGAP